MGIIQDLEELVAEIEKKKGLEPWLDTIWFVECRDLWYRFLHCAGPYLRRREDDQLILGWGGIPIRTENPPEEIAAPGIYLELSDGTFRQVDSGLFLGELFG